MSTVPNDQDSKSAETPEKTTDNQDNADIQADNENKEE